MKHLYILLITSITICFSNTETTTYTNTIQINNNKDFTIPLNMERVDGLLVIKKFLKENFYEILDVEMYTKGTAGWKHVNVVAQKGREKMKIHIYGPADGKVEKCQIFFNNTKLMYNFLINYFDQDILEYVTSGYDEAWDETITYFKFGKYYITTTQKGQSDERFEGEFDQFIDLDKNQIQIYIDTKSPF